jgi:tRNA threonylcarbamoyladenosine modification (KEOPS) complex Cgi121 subunit
VQHHFEEFGYYVEITGFRGITFKAADAYLKANRKEAQQKVWIQFFDADLIATSQHLYFAVLNALLAFRNKTNLSKSLAMETMLFASAQRQIQKAIALVGVKPETSDLAVVIIGKDAELVGGLLGEVSSSLGVKPFDAVLELSPKKIERIKDAYEVTSTMLQVVSKHEGDCDALVDLVLERMALLATQL